MQIRLALSDSIKNDGELQNLCAPIRKEFRTDSERAQASETSRDSITTAINDIHEGTHQELPRPESSHVSAGEHPGWSIENATPYTIQVYLSGSVKRESVIPSGGSVSFDVPPGNYEEAVDL
jgi:hypothetical protein